MAVLPPGVGAEAFGSAIRQFQAAVGADWVFTSDEDLFPYRDPFTFLKDEPGELLASAAVAPANVEQVQAIVRAANQHRIPLYTVSTGKNYGYGGASPNLHGSVILDLKRMNRILEVDEHRHFALVEPGVSYFDLYRYIQERGLKVWVDPPDPGWGSPLGNALDRGSGYTMGNYRDHASAHCGLEVVLPNGELMRTGMGAAPGSTAWNEHPVAFGPDPAGLFFQGNFGVVTKMGVRLMPAPEHWRAGVLAVPRRADLAGLVNTVNYATDLTLVGGALYYSPLRALLGDTEFKEEAERPGGFNEAALDRMAAAANLPAWSVELQFYGSEKTTAANWDYIKELIAKAVPAARAYDGDSFPAPLTKEQIQTARTTFNPVARRGVSQGIPGLRNWNSIGRTAAAPDEWNATHIGLMSVISRSAEAIFKFQQVTVETARKLETTSGVTAVSTPTNQQQYSFKMGSLWGAGLDSTPADRKKQLEIIKQVLAMNAEHGWGDYRAPPLMQDAVAAQYSFGDHALRRFHETLKDAIDPNGILSPGRGGVWPARFRSQRGGQA